MRNGWSSFTAALVTLARDVSTRDAALGGVCHDAIAHRMLPAPLRELASALEALPLPVLAGVRRLSLGLFDHIALRTGMIDDVLPAALAGGARQLVILGAGYDTRAFRLPALRGCRVFEVDHPDTQARKRERGAGLPLTAAEMQHVACDFHAGELERVLQQAGFDPAAPSVWLWEGVTVYLHEAAVRGTLATLARLSAPGSTLISTYVLPERVCGGALWALVAEAVLGAVAEPLRFVCTSEAFAALLQQHGFSVQRDLGTEAYASQAHVPLLALRVGMPREHVNVSVRLPEA